ncbi:hypothetical protein Vretifemale_9192, partial [Volvox reticuliferus]
ELLRQYCFHTVAEGKECRPVALMLRSYAYETPRRATGTLGTGGFVLHAYNTTMVCDYPVSEECMRESGPEFCVSREWSRRQRQEHWRRSTIRMILTTACTLAALAGGWWLLRLYAAAAMLARPGVLARDAAVASPLQNSAPAATLQWLTEASADAEAKVAGAATPSRISFQRPLVVMPWTGTTTMDPSSLVAAMANGGDVSGDSRAPSMGRTPSRTSTRTVGHSSLGCAGSGATGGGAGGLGRSGCVILEQVMGEPIYPQALSPGAETAPDVAPAAAAGGHKGGTTNEIRLEWNQHRRQDQLQVQQPPPDQVLEYLSRLYRTYEIISSVEDSSGASAPAVCAAAETQERIMHIRQTINGTGHAPALSAPGCDLYDHLEVSELIGSGTFGKVFKGFWHGTMVAVKLLVFPAALTGQSHLEKMAAMEAAISSSLSHPNIVQTYTWRVAPLLDTAPVQSSSPAVPAAAFTAAADKVSGVAPPHATAGQQQQQQHWPTQHSLKAVVDGRRSRRRHSPSSSAEPVWDRILIASSGGTPTSQEASDDDHHQQQEQVEQQQTQQHKEQQVLRFYQQEQEQQHQKQQQHQKSNDSHHDYLYSKSSGTTASPRSGPKQSADRQLLRRGQSPAVATASAPEMLLSPMEKAATHAISTSSPARQLLSPQPKWNAGPGNGTAASANRRLGAAANVLQEGFELCLILELCDAGSLRDHLVAGGFRSSEDHGSVDMLALLDVAMDVARAMAYLHAKSIVHSDLKSRNVLLKSVSGSPASLGRRCSVIAKVSDFGLSLRIDNDATHVSNMYQGTTAFMAPELLLYGRVSKASDVYSFGILMWELYTCGEAFKGVPKALLAAKIVEGLRLDFPPEVPPPYARLAQQCWTEDAGARPSFDQIVRELSCMRAALHGEPPPAPVQPLGSVTAQVRRNTSRSGVITQHPQRPQQYQQLRPDEQKRRLGKLELPAGAATSQRRGPLLETIASCCDSQDITVRTGGGGASSSSNPPQRLIEDLTGGLRGAVISQTNDGGCGGDSGGYSTYQAALRPLHSGGGGGAAAAAFAFAPAAGSSSLGAVHLQQLVEANLLVLGGCDGGSTMVALDELRRNWS